MQRPESEVRREKLQQLRDAGQNPYPSTAERSMMSEDVLAQFAELSASQKTLTLAGRLMTTRVHGALIFADLRDATGKIQILVKQDVVGDESFTLFLNHIDPADFIEATGTVFETQRGEKTLQVASWTVLSKALLPLPEKWHGLTDVEQRFRFRELDLIANPEVRDVARKRSRVVRALRRALDDEGFEEVETPMLQLIPGGASAKPFVTHHNALDTDLYLRIAPELYLKRLIVGGYEKVYELGRQFRNEGIDWSHNPEFTTLEFYWAYQDYRGLMDFTEKIITGIIQEVNGGLRVKHGEGEIDFAAPWPRVRFSDAIKKACGIDITSLSREELVERMKKLKIDTDYAKAGIGKLYDELYKDTVRSKQVEPIFMIDYPVEMQPLAKKCDDNPRFVQQFQLIAGRVELIKAYTELNDPLDQLERFEAQQALREKGDDEAQMIDRDFVKSLEHGMPPTAGWAVGVDRFVALLVDAPNLKETILFPTLRPEQKS